MRKLFWPFVVLLLILLLPSLCLSQNLKLDHSYTNATDFEVGDTITIKFNTIQVTEGADPNLYMFDYEYNNKLLQKITQDLKLRITKLIQMYKPR